MTRKLSSSTEETRGILKPFAFVVLPLLVTVSGACFLLACSLWQTGARKRACVCAAAFLPVGIGQLFYMWRFDASMWLSITCWIGVSILSGVLFYLIYRSPFHTFKKMHSQCESTPFEVTGLIAGIIAGSFTGFFLIYLLSALLLIM